MKCRFFGGRGRSLSKPQRFPVERRSNPNDYFFRNFDTLIMDMPRSKNQWPLRRFQIQSAASLEVAAAASAKLSAFQSRGDLLY